MSLKQRKRPVLAALASAALLSVALPALPVSAQKEKADETTEVGTTAPSAVTNFSVRIGDVTAVDSNIDATTLKGILESGAPEQAAQLAGLTASSVTITEIAVTYTSEIDGVSNSGEFIYADIVLSDIADGVAGSAQIGSSTLSDSLGTEGNFGPMTTSTLNIGGLLSFYGLAESQSDDFVTIYRDFVFTGGSVSSDEFSCDFGSIENAEFSARPTGVSFVDFMDLAAELEAAGDEPSPADVAAFMRSYAEILASFRSSPVIMNGIDCNGSDDGETVTFSIDSASMAGFEPGIYPAITMNGFNIAIAGGEDDGAVSIAEAVFKGFDFSEQIELLASVPDDIGDAWFEQNARQLIPSFFGFSVSGVDVDVPDPDSGERIVGGIGNFDLTLGDYVNAIPTSISTEGTNLRLQIPPDMEDEGLQMLTELGIDELDLGFALALVWNEANETIDVSRLSVEGANLASIAVSGTIAKAVADLFSDDVNLATATAMGLTVTDLEVDVEDYGGIDIFMTLAGQEQGASAAQMRPMMAGVVEGMAAGLLGGTPQATGVAQALGNFLRGGQGVTINVTANDPNGIGLPELMQAEQDPTVLLNQVTIDAQAR
jgi:hypothetical protein